MFDGDSITVIETPGFHKVLGPSYHVEVLAVEGKTINQRLPALVSALKRHPFAVVENLGTNDAIQGGEHYDWRSSWDNLILITRSTPCVVLTTISPAADSYGYGHKSIATSINAHILTLDARDPKRYKVAEWAGFLLAADTATGGRTYEPT